MSRSLTISPDKFVCFVRYMIQVAEQKRCVPYYELENCFGLNHEYAGFYAGKLGDFCISMKWPMLNGLIISSTDSRPSNGFDWYEKKYKKSWGEIVTDCWKKFHVTSTREKQSQNFSGINDEILSFIGEE